MWLPMAMKVRGMVAPSVGMLADYPCNACAWWCVERSACVESSREVGHGISGTVVLVESRVNEP